MLFNYTHAGMVRSEPHLDSKELHFAEWFFSLECVLYPSRNALSGPTVISTFGGGRSAPLPPAGAISARFMIMKQIHLTRLADAYNSVSQFGSMKKLGSTIAYLVHVKILLNTR